MAHFIALCNGVWESLELFLITHKLNMQTDVLLSFVQFLVQKTYFCMQFYMNAA